MRLCLFECVRARVLPGEAGQFEESQAKKRHLSIIRGGGWGTKLWNYICLRELVACAIISFRQIWKDPLDISIKPNKKTSPQRYCVLSVEWTTFYIYHNLQFQWESP